MPNGNPSSAISISWSTKEFEKLIDLIKPHPCLYKGQDFSRKNILAKETTWEQIANELSKPVEECKTRWKALRDGYMKTNRIGIKNRNNTELFNKLEFLDDADPSEGVDDGVKVTVVHKKEDDMEQQVITDNQEYYEITLVDNPQEQKQLMPKLILKPLDTGEQPKKIGKKYSRKRSMLPTTSGMQPIKILPKPVMINGAKVIQYVDEVPKAVPNAVPQQPRSEILDSLIEKVLKEHTNEIDVFFRSMAASVKKLQPNLIPKVKMEVCNVIAKYEMQSFEKSSSF